MVRLHTFSWIITAGLTGLLPCLLLVALAGSTLGAEPKGHKVVQRIDIVHMTHTDTGFTDHPLVCRRQQMRYLDIAIDAVLATGDVPPERQFVWTAETTLAVDDWWRAADAARRETFLKAVATGRLEITALAMNQTPAPWIGCATRSERRSPSTKGSGPTGGPTAARPARGKWPPAAGLNVWLPPPPRRSGAPRTKQPAGPPTKSTGTCACSMSTPGEPATVSASPTRSTPGPNTTKSRERLTARWLHRP